MSSLPNFLEALSCFCNCYYWYAVIMLNRTCGEKHPLQKVRWVWKLLEFFSLSFFPLAYSCPLALWTDPSKCQQNPIHHGYLRVPCSLKTKAVITKRRIVAICQVFNGVWGCDAKNSCSDRGRWDSWLSQRAAHVLPCLSIRSGAIWSSLSCSSPTGGLAGNCENLWRTWVFFLRVCSAGKIWP